MAVSHTEAAQRVLAVLYLQSQGSITSEQGSASARIRALMAGRPLASSYVRKTIAGLEAEGYVVRDNRTGANAKPVQMNNVSLKAGIRCYGVYLAVEKDDLLAPAGPLHKEYVDELRAHIDKRMAARAKGRAIRTQGPTRVVEGTNPAPAPTSTHASVPEPAGAHQASIPATPVPGLPPEASLVADALLARVIEMAQTPSAPAVDVEGYQTRIARLEHEIKVRDDNISKLTHRVDELAGENERLQRRQRSERLDSKRLTESIAGLIGPDASKALTRLGNGR